MTTKGIKNLSRKQETREKVTRKRGWVPHQTLTHQNHQKVFTIGGYDPSIVVNRMKKMSSVDYEVGTNLLDQMSIQIEWIFHQ